MNRKSFLASVFAALTLSRQPQAQTRKYKDGYCPTCGTKAAEWTLDKDRFNSNPAIKNIGPHDPVAFVDGWTTHICHVCRTVFAVKS